MSVKLGDDDGIIDFKAITPKRAVVVAEKTIEALLIQKRDRNAAEKAFRHAVTQEEVITLLRPSLGKHTYPAVRAAFVELYDRWGPFLQRRQGYAGRGADSVPSGSFLLYDANDITNIMMVTNCQKRHSNYASRSNYRFAERFEGGPEILTSAGVDSEVLVDAVHNEYSAGSSMKHAYQSLRGVEAELAE